ncbi:hypothetical protein BHM03_00001990 [Ensete ventricosum]|uniref:Peptidase M20 dimerisation domain-containing protein n=1 Tax=Ensete ventricosum TaxID=4639 RepID=A0A445M9D6_ENSVE|nr:hypothetical protein BHM03_00001990 [Ensete ventricosum]
MFLYHRPRPLSRTRRDCELVLVERSEVTPRLMAVVSGKHSLFYSVPAKNASVPSLLIALILLLIAGNRIVVGWYLFLVFFGDFDPFFCYLFGILEGLEAESVDDGRNQLFVGILRDEAVERINQLAKVGAKLLLFFFVVFPHDSWVLWSKQDTVVDAGKFDGSLGIICAISALKVLKTNGKLHKLSRPVEVSGVKVSGSQGHAGTVPMLMRQDPMAAAAELIVNLESLCKYPDGVLIYNEQCGSYKKESFSGLVCTVNFTVDIRAMDDDDRGAIVSEFSRQVYQICDNRMVNCTIEHKLSQQLKQAAHSTVEKMPRKIKGEVPMLMSGAGHDAMAMSHLTKVGMLFVRCRGGISHSPDEYASDNDVWAAGLALLHFLDRHVSGDYMSS